MLIPRRTMAQAAPPAPHRFATGGTELAFMIRDSGTRGCLRHQPSDRSCSYRTTRHVKRGGKVWISIFPDRPLTKKPAENSYGFR